MREMPSRISHIPKKSATGRGPTTERHEADGHWLVVVVQLRFSPSHVQGEARCPFQTRVLHTKDTRTNAIGLPEHVTSLLLESPRAPKVEPNDLWCPAGIASFVLATPPCPLPPTIYYIIILPTATEA